MATLQVMVQVRSAQMADPELASALALFRRAANVIARLEDAVVFRGLLASPAGIIPPAGVASLPPIWQIQGGRETPGLWASGPRAPWPWTAPPFLAPAAWQWIPIPTTMPPGDALVVAVSNAIGVLEANGHFGPFATVLDQQLFLSAQTPAPGSSLVLPQDRIIPFLGGGPLLRSSTIDPSNGVVVALGGAPVELVIATDVSLQFLQITAAPVFLFRVREKIALRIKQDGAIVRLYVPPQPYITAFAVSAGYVIITGQNFLEATEVLFGQPVGAGGFTINSDTQITLLLPPGDPGDIVQVAVTTAGGTTTQAIQFTY